MPSPMTEACKPKLHYNKTQRLWLNKEVKKRKKERKKRVGRSKKEKWSPQACDTWPENLASFDAANDPCTFKEKPRQSCASLFRKCKTK